MLSLALFFFKTALDIQDFLWFGTDFRIVFPISVGKKAIIILLEIALDL